MSIENQQRATSPRAASTVVIFDHEKLDVYQFELRFIEWVTPLLEEALETAKGKAREVCDQLDRASLSALLNTAEGNGRRQRQVRAKFFDDARGSATECAACLDALVAKKIFSAAHVRDGKSFLLRIVSMLCGLFDRFDDAAGHLRDEEADLHIHNATRIESYSDSRRRTRTRTSRKRKI